MDVTTILKNLHSVEEKFKDKFVYTGELNIVAMAQDVRRCIEQLQQENERLKS